jgi:tetratricopeptide (TPR) repeat protein
LLNDPGQTNVRLLASYHAGVGWASDKCEESIKSFEAAIKILNNAADHTTSPEALSYTVALLNAQVEVLGDPPNKTRKRKRTAKEDVTKQLPDSPSIKIERALLQMQLEWNAQRMHPKFGKNHPETVQTMVQIGLAYKTQANIKKREGAISKSLEIYHQSKEIYFRDALEILGNVLGDDHPETLWLLHEVAQMDLNKGCTSEGLQKLERALIQQRYVLGDDDPDTVATIKRLEQLYRDKGEVNKLADLPKKLKAVACGKRRARIIVPEEEIETPVDCNEVSLSNS